MSLLTGLWMLSAVFAVSAILVMLILIVRRLFDAAADRRTARRRRDLEMTLISALDHPDSLQGVQIGSTDALLLGDIAMDLNNSIRGETKDALIKVLSGLGVDRFYTEAIASPKSAVRERAVRGLSLFASPASFDALWRALSDPELAIRLAAARHIVNAERPFSVPDFIDILQVGDVVQSRELRPIMVRLAEKYPEGLIDALQRAQNPARRLFLIYAIGRSGRFDFSRALVPLAMSDSVNERAEVVRALGTLGSPEGRPAILWALEDPSWEVRAQAAQAAASIGLTDAIDRLAGMLSEEQWWVRYRAAWALWRLGDEGRAKLTSASHLSERAARIVDLVTAESAAKPQ